MNKAVEQRLYEAWRLRRGIRLSADEVYELVNPDSAVRSRILNVAAEEAGLNVLDEDVGVAIYPCETWEAVKRRLATREATP